MAHVLPDLSERGLFSDSFGVLTALFSGSAFLAMTYTINLQMKELRLQREELMLTRQELAAAKEEQRRSADAQQEMVEKQISAAKITELSALVQGRYQYASSWGANAHRQVRLVVDIEQELVKAMEEAGLGKVELKSIE